MYKTYPTIQSTLTLSGGNLTLIGCTIETSGTGVIIKGYPDKPINPEPIYPTPNTIINPEPQCIVCYDGLEFCGTCVNTHPEDEHYPDYDDNEDIWCECDDPECEDCNPYS